jgi:hypothetical protein
MRIRRVDSNQKEIVRRLRLIPLLTVAHTHTVGKGIPDVIVGYQGINYLFEIKDGSLPKSRKKLTEAEQSFHDSWAGKIHIIESFDDVLNILKIA